MLHKPLSSLDYHLGNPLVMLRQLVKGGIDHLHIGPFNGLLNIGNLLRPFIDQKDDQMHLGGIALHGFGHIL